MVEMAERVPGSISGDFAREESVSESGGVSGSRRKDLLSLAPSNPRENVGGAYMDLELSIPDPI